ncbi:restriction endonuclease [Dactylosporangium cerinum]
MKLVDSLGRHFRQVDIWLPRTREIVECKHQIRPVDVGVVDRLVGTIDDLNASGARIVSHSGFTKTASLRAAKANIECLTLPFDNSPARLHPAGGEGFYCGSYVDLCQSSSPDCDSYGRITYETGYGGDALLCVGNSVDWGNRQMHAFIAHIVLSHSIAVPPSDAMVDDFLIEFGERFDAGREWRLREAEVGHVIHSFYE